MLESTFACRESPIVTGLLGTLLVVAPENWTDRCDGHHPEPRVSASKGDWIVSDFFVSAPTPCVENSALLVLECAMK